MKKKHKHQEWAPEADVHMVEPETSETGLEKPEVESDIDTPVQISDTPSRMTGQNLYETYVRTFKEKFNEGHHLRWNELSKPVQGAWDEIAVNTVDAILNAA